MASVDSKRLRKKKPKKGNKLDPVDVMMLEKYKQHEVESQQQNNRVGGNENDDLNITASKSVANSQDTKVCYCKA